MGRGCAWGWLALARRGQLRGANRLIHVNTPIPCTPHHLQKKVAAVVGTIKSHPNQELKVVVQRDSKELTVPVVPLVGRDGGGTIGVSLYSNTYIKHTKADSIGGV